jgi:predicted transposase/invertase (TIGR01784 family)
MRKQMGVEDNILCEFEDMQREIMQYKEKIAEVEQEASEAKRKVIQNMKIKGIPVDDICEITGLSREEIESV